MNKQELREIVSDQHHQKLTPFNDGLIQRDALAKVQYYLKSKQILVISGIRRCGKSTLMQQIRQQTPNSDYYLNFDDERLIHFTVEDFQKLVEVFIELYGEQHNYYFDEIQNIPAWERFVRRLHDAGKQVIVTGSNASMLSQELGTHLTGRHYQLQLYPFSFKEYLRYKKIDAEDKLSTTAKITLQKAMMSYIETGGMPGYLATMQKEYLRSVYENILYRDIVARYHINKIPELKDLVYYAASNIGSVVSFNKIKNMLNIRSATTVKDFFDFLRNSYLFFLLPKFDYSVKRQVLANKKLYTLDTGIAQLLGFHFSQDLGHLLENIVFIELMRREHDLYYHQQDKECDFIVKNNNSVTQAIQVTTSLEDKATKEREINGLVDAMKEHQLQKGYILTLDESSDESIMINDKKCAIKIMPVWRFLLTDTELGEDAI